MFLKKMKDGGEHSTVTGYWLVEIKSLLSIVLLKFEGKSRAAYHSHAFNCLNWLIHGRLKEKRITDTGVELIEYIPSFIPFVIKREHFHKVDSDNTSWVLSIRGPWTNTWYDYDEETDKLSVLTHGRIEHGRL